MIDEVQSGAAQLVDVRSLEEWEGGHARGALHIPIDALVSGETSALHIDKKIYTYCAAGGRAGRAASYLKEHGFDAANAGGLRDWLQAGGALADEAPG